MNETTPKNAYFIMESVKNSEGELIPCIATENESGYHRTDWLWGKDIDKAEEIADMKNLAMGISRKEAARIVLSSMR